jgi:hypothetical protein
MVNVDGVCILTSKVAKCDFCWEGYDIRSPAKTLMWSLDDLKIRLDASLIFNPDHKEITNKECYSCLDDMTLKADA